MPVNKGYGIKGVPDFVGNIGPMALYIETKHTKNKKWLSPQQRRRCWEIAESGACCLVIDETNVEQLPELVRAFAWRNGV